MAATQLQRVFRRTELGNELLPFANDDKACIGRHSSPA